MIDRDLKAELLNELNNTENFVEHYPTIRRNESNEPVNELVLFYSKKPRFKSKIYIIQLDRFPMISSDFPEPFEVWYLDRAVTDLVEKHHEINNIDNDDINLNIKLIDNEMHINHLYFNDKSLRNEIERIRLLINKLK